MRIKRTTALSLDPVADSCVQPLMASSLKSLPGSRLGFALLTLILGAAVACGGKDKKDSTTPTPGDGSGSGSAVVGNPEDIDPEGGLNTGGGPGTGDPGTGDPGTGDPGTGDPGTGDPGTEKPPEIKPPGLDLSPAQKAARVKEHVRKGEAALTSSTPDPDLAITEAKSALSVDETSVKSMLLLAYANVHKKYYDQALDVLQKAAKRGGSKNRQLHFLFGLVYDRTDQPDEAFKSYQRAVSLAPNYKSALMNLGVHYLRNQRYNDAASAYERLTGSLNYKTAAAWTNLGSAYRGQSAASGLAESRRNALILKAESTYKRAISANKNYANAYYNLGLLYLDSDPFPLGGDEMGTMARLKRAKTYFDEYRRLPGTDTKRVDEVAATAAKLIARQERIEKKARERKAREAKEKANGGN